MALFFKVKSSYGSEQGMARPSKFKSQHDSEQRLKIRAGTIESIDRERARDGTIESTASLRKLQVLLLTKRYRPLRAIGAVARMQKTLCVASAGSLSISSETYAR